LFLWNGLGPRPLTAQFLEKRLGGPRRLQTWPYWPHFGSWQALADHLNTGSFTVGLMRHRRNGWVSLDAGAHSGTFLTKPLKTAGTLAINARVRPRGSMHIEVLTEGGKPIPAYSGANAAIFTGDSTGQRVAWQGGKRAQLPRSAIRLRIHMRKAELFALQF